MMRIANRAVISRREEKECCREKDQHILPARGLTGQPGSRFCNSIPERYCTSGTTIHGMKKDNAKFQASSSKKSKLRLLSRNMPSLLDSCDSSSIRDDQNTFRSFLADESRTREHFVPEDGDEVQPLPMDIKRWNQPKTHDQQICQKTTLETATLVTEDSSQFSDLYTSYTSASASAAPPALAVHQEEFGEPDTRFERLYRLGTQELLMKRTLGYIKGLQESERSIKMDMKWRDYREKTKSNATPKSLSKTTDRLYELSKSKQNEGKKRRDKIATARALKAAENHPGGYAVRGSLPREVDSPSPRQGGRKHWQGSRSVCSENSDTTGKTNKSCNATFDRLYDLSKRRQDEGRHRRQHVKQNSGLRFPEKMAEVLDPREARKSTDGRSPRRSSRKATLDEFRNGYNYVRNTSNTIHDSLYNFSKKRQEEGRQLRNQIMNKSGRRFPEKFH